MTEKEQFLFNQQENVQTNSKEGRVCKYCGYELEEDSAFCPGCGQKVNGEEKVCPVCKNTCTTEYCPHCGYKVIPTTCPKCGAESHYTFCIECGEILNETFKKVLEKQEEPLQAMSEEMQREADKIFENVITPEVQAYLNKIDEHEILLEEREYFNKREKRIIQVFGKNPIEFTMPDEKEQAFKIKAYASLGKVVKEREERIKKETLEKLYPKLEAEYKAEDEEIKKREEEEKERERLEEEERRKQEEIKRRELQAKKEEMDRRFSQIMSNVSSALERSQLEEKKRLEEERLRKEEEERQRREREAELERQRQAAQRERERQREAILREERREREKKQLEQRELQRMADNRILGRYVYRSSRETVVIAISSKSGSRISGYTRTNSVYGQGSGSFEGYIFGQQIVLNERRYSSTIRGYLINFSGVIAEDGDWIIGSWGNGQSEYARV